jgi:hypothetical protein
MHSIPGNGYNWFDCASDKQHKTKLSRNIVVVQFQWPNKTVAFLLWIYLVYNFNFIFYILVGVDSGNRPGLLVASGRQEMERLRHRVGRGR